MKARETRIGRRYAWRDELQRQMFAIAVNAVRLQDLHADPDIEFEVRQRLLAEEDRAFEIVEATTIKLVDSLAEAAGTYRWKVRDLVVQYGNQARGITLSQRTRKEKGRILVELTTPLLDGLFGSPWRPDKRVRGFRSAEALLRQHLD